MRLAPQAITGILFLLAAVLAGAVWYMYLFVAVPPNLSVLQHATGLLQYTFSPENPQRLWFAWMVALPLLCVVLGVAYLMNGARTRRGWLVLLSASVLLAIASFVLNDLALAVFVALPILWGYRSFHAT
jgi:hypothetical protein